MTPGPDRYRYRFPLERTNDRELPPDYGGPIDVWDIDKTYLESRFEKWTDLVGAALERAIDKRTRPGVAPLLSALRRGPEPADPWRLRAPLYFVSASPPQLRRVLERKMLIDGVEYDGISFKDHFALVRAGRLKEVRRHVAYKLTALLEYRLEWPPGAREWLYGDDAESDALIYSLYADIRAGRMKGAKLETALAKEKVQAEDRKRIAALAEQAAGRTASEVAGIYVFRVATAPKLDLADFPLVTAVADAAECAFHLASRGRIAPEAIPEIERGVKGAGE